MEEMIPLPRRGRTALGLFLSHLEGSYQQRLYRGFDSLCREEDCDLVVFCSRYSPGGETGRAFGESIFDLADKTRLDGLCVDSSAFAGEEACARFLEGAASLSGLPLVFSSMECPGHPSVLPDNAGGMGAILSHLAATHGARSIAFAGGPRGTRDARLRLEAWRSFMDEAGFARDESLEYEGRFDAESGAAAVKRFLAREALPDAIAFASDEMARGGLAELRRRGVKVPEDVAITGFDDNVLSAHEFPPLASASQAVEEKARICAKLLLKRIEGYPAPMRIELPVNFVPRESCGCMSERLDARTLLVRSQGAIERMKLIAERLGPVSCLEELGEEFPSLFPSISDAPAFICLYDQDRSWSHVVAAADGNGARLVDPLAPRRFASTQLVPSYLLGEDRRSLVAQSLYRGERDFGFLVCADEEGSSDVFAALGYQVSAALSNIAHLREREEGERRLKDALAFAEESERRFRELAELLPAFVMESTGEGRVAYLNKAGKDLLGVGSDAAAAELSIDRFVKEATLLDEGSGFARLVLRSSAGREFALLGRRMETASKDGVVRWIGMDFKPLLSAMLLPDEEMLAPFRLSAREREVLSLELEGLLGKEIADRLSISLSTVKGHIGSLYRKLGVGSREQLFALVRDRLASRWGYESLMFSLLSGIARV